MLGVEKRSDTALSQTLDIYGRTLLFLSPIIHHVKKDKHAVS